MGKKVLIVLGIGAGYILTRKELKDNPDGTVARTVRLVTDNSLVRKGVHSAQAKISEVTRKQGEVVTDKVANIVKERLFGVENSSGVPTEIVDVEVEEVVIEVSEPEEE